MVGVRQWCGRLHCNNSQRLLSLLHARKVDHHHRTRPVWTGRDEAPRGRRPGGGNERPSGTGAIHPHRRAGHGGADPGSDAHGERTGLSDSSLLILRARDVLVGIVTLIGGKVDTILCLHDIPIGPYTARAMITLPDGSMYRLPVSPDGIGGREPGESAEHEFPISPGT